MNILHYSLGLPPYRSGGLTKYSFDLMKEQLKNGENVYLLFPGRMNFANEKVKIKSYINKSKIKAYELVNPLPIPLLNGISSPKLFMRKCEKNIFLDFLINNKIEIVHVHTLMGIFLEFFEACKELNIKVVYTTHDYFGICPKVNFIDYNGELCENRDVIKCLKCNKKSSSITKIKILQSPIYRFSKNIGIISYIKKIINIYNKKENNIETDFDYNNSNEEIEEFNELNIYYERILKKIDYFLFNSNVTKAVYDKYIDSNGEILTITHADIKDNKKKKVFNNIIKMTYLGPDKKYKGFYLLLDVIEELNKEYKDIVELNMFGDINNKYIYENIKVNGKYSYSELEKIFDDTDLLIVPSIWYETFGFIVLEALSFGVPVIMTENVGSKDLIIEEELKKIMIFNGNKIDLKNRIVEIIENRSILKSINEKIITSINIENEYNHYKKVKKIYLELLDKGEEA